MKYKVGTKVQWKEILPTTRLPYFFQGTIAEVAEDTCRIRMKNGISCVVRKEIIRYADE